MTSNYNKLRSQQQQPVGFMASRNRGANRCEINVPGDDIDEITDKVREQRDPFFPLSGPTLYYNWTEDLVQDWTRYGHPWTLIFYILADIVLNVFYFACHGWIYSQFPGISPEIILLRTILMFILVWFVVGKWGFWTGGYLIPWISFLMAFNFNFFQNTQLQKDGKKRSWWLYELLVKPLMSVIIQLAAAFVGIALIGLTTNNAGVTTSDCAVDAVASCDAAPRPNGIDTVPSYFIQIFGIMFIAAGYLFPSYSVAAPTSDTREEREAVRRKFKNVQGRTVGGMYALVHGVFGGQMGGCWNTMYWLVTSVYINDFEHKGIYIWPSLVGVLIVAVVLVAVNWFMGVSQGADKDDGDLKEM